MMNCRPGKPFPAKDNIGEFLDKSKNGVVFMSFGSFIKASVMPKENKDIILKVFARFPQYDFIWKWEEELPNAPKNVLGMNYYTGTPPLTWFSYTAVFHLTWFFF